MLGSTSTAMNMTPHADSREMQHATITELAAQEARVRRTNYPRPQSTGAAMIWGLKVTLVT